MRYKERAMRSGCIQAVLFVLIVVSLALHALTIYAALQVRAEAKQQIIALADQLAAAEKQDLTFEVRQTRSIPIQAVVPVQKQLTVPINTTVNIDQIIQVPINTPLGNTTISLPIKTSVPVNASVPVVISETVQISTSISFEGSIPVNVPAAQSPLTAVLEQLRQQLLAISVRF
jgi:hypothetical protein